MPEKPGSQGKGWYGYIQSKSRTKVPGGSFVPLTWIKQYPFLIGMLFSNLVISIG